MTEALVVIGIVALVSTGLVVILMFRLLKQGGSRSEDSALGHQVGEIRQGMDRVNRAIQDLNLDRVKQSERLETMLTSLNSSSSALRDILANTQVRGQWGERMAEDVFRLIGFVETVNYTKQTTVADGHSRPDFTILMPEGKKLIIESGPNTVGASLSALQLDDIEKASPPFDPKATVSTEVTTFDGLSIKVLSAKRDGNFWFRLEASGDGEAAKEADEIIARTGGWTYKISSYAASNIAKRLENLVEDAKPKS